MLRMLANKRGQNTAEYAILIGVVVAAIIGIQLYVKRGAQARFKDASDNVVTSIAADGNWATISSTDATKQFQFEHGNLKDTNIKGKSTTVVSKDEDEYDMAKAGTSTRTMTRTTAPLAEDYQEQGYKLLNVGENVNAE